MRAFRAHLEGLVRGKIYSQISDSKDVTFPIGYNAQCMPPIVKNVVILNAYGLNLNATVSMTNEGMKVLKEKSDMLTQAKLDLQMIDFVKPWKDPLILADAFTFDSWYPSCIAKLIECNDAIIAKYGKTSDKARELGSALVILNNVISAKVHDNPIFRKLVIEGRHHLISIILMTQDPKAIRPCIHDNMDVAVIFNQKTFRNKESIWADFMNNTTKDLARAIMAKYCVEHNALVAIQTNLNADIMQNFFKTIGDKTKLQDSTYALGSVEQKKIIFAERRKCEKDVRRHEAEGITTCVTAEDIKKLTTSEILKCR
eukprot:m51a1_g13991 hypothetical protein (314) ;mRNA; r:1054700-1055697